jgi:drug/metabolite transporter (DMT)-like permease
MTVSSRLEPTRPASRLGVDRVGVAALVAGTAIIAWSGTLARLLDVGPLAGAAWRMGLAVPALAAWTRFAERRPLRGPDLAPSAGLLILAGLAFALDVGSFHLSLTGTKVANATFIGNVAPILTVVGGALIFHERPSWRVWLALGLALVGAWIMAGMVAPVRVGFGDAFALSAAIAYASYLLLIKQLRLRLDAAAATLWSAAVSAVVLAAAASLHGEKMIPSSPFGWMIVALLGFVTHATGQGLTSAAMGRAPVGLIALVLLAQPPFSALIAWSVLGESMTPQQIAGGAIILVAVLLSRPAAPIRRAALGEAPHRRGAFRRAHGPFSLFTCARPRRLR